MLHPLSQRPAALHCFHRLQGNGVAQAAAQVESATAKHDPFTAPRQTATAKRDPFTDPRKRSSRREDNYGEVLSLAYMFYEGQMAGDLPS